MKPLAGYMAVDQYGNGLGFVEPFEETVKAMTNERVAHVEIREVPRKPRGRRAK